VNIDELVTKYIDAWNQRDVPGLLDLMHPGAAYYDAFWAETCVGRDLAQYFQDAMEEEPFWYSRVGDTITTENGVVFRYSAHQVAGSKIGEPIHFGAEILHVQNDKILTVTDIYCSSEEENLREVAELAVRRHGLPHHANSGFGALKMARIKAGLAVRLEEERDDLDPNITMSQLADRIGCTLSQLSVVIENQFGLGASDFLNVRRVNFSRELLRNLTEGTVNLEKVAASAGFRSVREFSKIFADTVGVTPEEFVSQQQQNDLSRDNSSLH